MWLARDELTVPGILSDCKRSLIFEHASDMLPWPDEKFRYSSETGAEPAAGRFRAPQNQG
jgi:hypothetical protein